MPIDYAVQGEEGGDADERLVRNLLGDESRVPDPDGVGAVRLVTVVWAGTGQDAVDIEAWARFRLNDVPVSESFDEVDGN